ncbi:unnamed protein product [Meloidogyne enterolobii]|uniref:Uncharacterized protein n=2 Tax=Meloidogyne enterolobii TaxID=390850 RepID=A0A6V7WMA5_MELEN|nr:unnamed protein product [Meloidogyne enterolobii]
MGLLTILMYILAMIFIVYFAFITGYYTNTYVRFHYELEIIPDEGQPYYFRIDRAGQSNAMKRKIRDAQLGSEAGTANENTDHEA